MWYIYWNPTFFNHFSTEIKTDDKNNNNKNNHFIIYYIYYYKSILQTYILSISVTLSIDWYQSII